MVDANPLNRSDILPQGLGTLSDADSISDTEPSSAPVLPLHQGPRPSSSFASLVTAIAARVWFLKFCFIPEDKPQLQTYDGQHQYDCYMRIALHGAYSFNAGPPDQRGNRPHVTLYDFVSAFLPHKNLKHWWPHVTLVYYITPFLQEYQHMVFTVRHAANELVNPTNPGMFRLVHNRGDPPTILTITGSGPSSLLSSLFRLRAVIMSMAAAHSSHILSLSIPFQHCSLSRTCLDNDTPSTDDDSPPMSFADSRAELRALLHFSSHAFSSLSHGSNMVFSSHGS